MTSKKKSNPVIPKNIGLVMGSEDERNWTRVRDDSLVNLKVSEFDVKLQRAVFLIAAKKIRAEKKLFRQK